MSKAVEISQGGTDYGSNVWLYWSFVLLGCGVLTPWNALLAAIDYFDDVYPDYNTLRWISMIYMPVFIIGLTASCMTPARNRGQNRITIGFSLFAVTIGLIPIIDLWFIRHGRGTDLTFAMLLICVVVLSVSEGIGEGSLVGLSIYLPLHYCQAYLIGAGVSGIVSVSLRSITKAIFTDSTEGLRISACIFFFLAVALSLTCIVVHRFVIMPNPLFQYQQMTDPEQQADTQRAPKSQELSKVTLNDVWRIASKIKMANLNMVINGVVTLTVYPGVPSDVESDALGDWYGVMLVGVFCVADFCARMIPAKYVSTNPRLVTTLNVMRTSLIPSIFLAVKLFSNPVSISLLIFVHGFSNGYLFLCCFAMGQEKMQGKDESFIGGSILTAVMILGFALGSVCSLIWSQID